jgi:hypothetical protein
MPRPAPSRLLLLTGFLALFAGCASPTSPNAIMDRVDANRNEYEEWPLPVKEAVLNGQVLKGMNATQVYVARGRPAERVDRGNGDEIWVYRVRAEGSSGGGSMIPRGTTISVGTGGLGAGAGYPGAGYPYPGSYPGSYPGGYPGSYPGTYPGGSGIYLPPITLGGGGGGEENYDEEEIVFRNGVVSHGDGVK